MTSSKQKTAQQAGQRGKNTPCPHPSKRAYPSYRHADAALGKNLRNGRGGRLAMRVYLCACGAWHLTSKPYRPRPRS